MNTHIVSEATDRIISELNINDLPCEMIVKIMQLLDVRSLKNALLTCKLWNSLIESAYRWPLTLSLFDRNREQKTHFTLATNRKFGIVKLRWGYFRECREIYDTLRKHGVNVVKLILEGYVFSLYEIVNLLSLMPNLKHAVIKIDPLPDLCDIPLDYVVPDLKKLKKLELSFPDLHIIKCFRNAKLTTMIIWEDDKSVHYDSLVEFLSSQDKLTSLVVINYSSPRSVLVEMGKLGAPIPFRLSKLGIAFDTLYDHNNLLKFIESQTETLKRLEINDSTDAYNSLIEPVFAMTNLNTLNVSVGQIPRDKDVYTRLKANHSVRTITLSNCLNDGVSHLRYFFEKFPNVHSLTLTGSSPDNNNKILLTAQSLSKLESLSLLKADGVSFDCMKFWNLKSLQIYQLTDKTDWNQFTKIHSQMVELSIVLICEHRFSIIDFNQIVTNVDLQCIRLGGCFTVDDQFFDIIRTKCTNLRELHLPIDSLAPELRNSVESTNVLRLYNCVDDIICKEIFNRNLSEEMSD